MDLYRLVNLYWSYEEVDWPGTDFVILATVEDDPWQMAAVGRGGRVGGVLLRRGGEAVRPLGPAGRRWCNKEKARL